MHRVELANPGGGDSWANWGGTEEKRKDYIQYQAIRLKVESTKVDGCKLGLERRMGSKNMFFRAKPIACRLVTPPPAYAKREGACVPPKLPACEGK